MKHCWAKSWNYNHSQAPRKARTPILAKNTGRLPPCPVSLPTISKNKPKYQTMDKLRIDKWLWAARFYKTRSLATDEVGKGRVAINDQTVKASREVKVGDLIKARQGDITRTIRVLGLSDQRGSAPVAQALYEETPESVTARENTSVQRRLAREPALSIEQGRPTKRNRRDLEKVKQGGWNDRWSASLQGD
jgi:ribosome-associated heat shock protein Hsp15